MELDLDRWIAVAVCSGCDLGGHCGLGQKGATKARGGITLRTRTLRHVPLRRRQLKLLTVSGHGRCSLFEGCLCAGSTTPTGLMRRFLARSIGDQGRFDRKYGVETMYKLIGPDSNRSEFGAEQSSSPHSPPRSSADTSVD